MSKKPGPIESPYSGRWVARVGGRIVGQGGTPEAAREAASANRHKEKIEVAYMHTSWFPPAADLISRIVPLAAGGGLHLVGGAMRDNLLHRETHDYDFVVAGDSIDLAKRVARLFKADFYVLDEEFGAARVLVTRDDGTRDTLDFSSMRGESIDADLRARDFTVNAIAMNVQDGTTLDPLHGAADVRAKLIRVCTPSALEDDPIRILRAVRLAAALEFRIEDETCAGLKATAHMLAANSAERKRDELFRMLGGRKAEACMRALEMLGVFPHVLPELSSLKGVEQSTPHVHDVWHHTLSVMRHLEEILELVLEGDVEAANGIRASLLTLGIGRYRQQIAEHFSTGLNPDRPLRALLQFAALYHDAGKPAMRTRHENGRIRFIGHEKESAALVVQRAAQLNLSNHELEWLRVVAANHLRFFFLASRLEMEGQVPSRQSIHRFFRDTGPTSVALVLLGLADLRGTRDHLLTEPAWSAWVSVARSLFENLWEKPDEAIAPPRLLDGNDLMKQLGLPQGQEIGLVLDAIREAQAAGEIRDRERALAFARDWLSRHRGGAAY